MSKKTYRAVHDHQGWYVVNGEGIAVTEPHPNRGFTEDRAEALNLGRQSRQQAQETDNKS